jgi:hypothetical protein
MVAALLVLAAALFIEKRPVCASVALGVTVLFRADAVLLVLTAAFALALIRATSWRAAAVGIGVALLAFGIASIKLDNPRDPNNGLTPANDGLVHATLAVLARNPTLGEGDAKLMALYRKIPERYDLLCSLSMWCSTSRAVVDLDAARKSDTTSTLIKANLRFLRNDPILTIKVWTTRIWLAATLKLAPHELGRADVLPFSRVDTIKTSATEANRALVERHRVFYERFGGVYAPALFLGLWLVGGAIARSRVLLGLALAAITVFPLKVFLLPTQEVRYYFPEITMALLAMGIGVIGILKKLRFRTDRANRPT